MAKVCTACGLKANSDGNLVVNAGVLADWTAAGFTCDMANGAGLYCDATDGVLRAAPEKFIRSGFAVASFGTGELTSFAPVSPAPSHPFTTLPGTATVTIANPSPCRPMNVDLRFGVNHGDFENNKQPFVDLGTNESRVELIPILTTVGTTADVVNNQGGHVIWGGAAFESLDSQGASSLRNFVIAAGATATFTIGATIRVDVYNGDTQLVNYQTFVDVRAYNP